MKNVSHSEQFWPFFLCFGLGSLIIVSQFALGVRLKFPDMSRHSVWCKNTLACINVLPQLVSPYNDTYHTSIKMKPSQVDKANEPKVWDTLYGNDVEKRVRFKFQVGDRVRVSKVKWVLLYTSEWLVRYPHGEIVDGTFWVKESVKE